MSVGGGAEIPGAGALADRLDRQLAFLLAADALKGVERLNRLLDDSRRENAAEHSWHLALMAMMLAEHAPAETDIARVVEILIAHDLVEIYAGDHWGGEGDPQDMAAKEAAAAEALFALLPPDQGRHLAALWHQFEARQSPEARFAKALDALHPMILVWGPGGSGTTHAPLTATAMREMKRPALEPFPELWRMAQRLLDVAVERGVLPP